MWPTSLRLGDLGRRTIFKNWLRDAREDTSATANLAKPRTNRATVMSSSAAIPKRNCVVQIVGRRLLFESSDERTFQLGANAGASPDPRKAPEERIPQSGSKLHVSQKYLNRHNRDRGYAAAGRLQ